MLYSITNLWHLQSLFLVRFCILSMSSHAQSIKELTKKKKKKKKKKKPILDNNLSL